jgi:drug/metabolite transporter (DMT)-like permease
VTVAGLVHLPFSSMAAADALRVATASSGLVAGVGFTLFAMSLALQFGLSRLPANRAIVILLFELVVAAIASYFLAGEEMRMQDWVGGALIVAASVAGGFVESRRVG